MAESKKTSLIVNQAGAGAGISGVIGFGIFMLIAAVFFVTENYFISLFLVSIGLLVYVTGTDATKVFQSSFKVFFSTRHLLPKAIYIEETLQALQKQNGSTITLPNNPLSKDIQKIVGHGKDFNYAEYIVHSYYVESHELYDYASGNLDFVAVSMPIFGLMGTVLGLMSMFDNLGGDISVEALSPQLAMALKTTLYGAFYSIVYKILGARFEQRIKALDYDYETLCRTLQVLIESKAKIEVSDK